MKGKFLRFICLVVIFLVSTYCVPAVSFAKIDIPEASSEFYVNDFAQIISPADKEQMMTSAVNLAETTGGVQIVITTIKSLNKQSIDDYALEMYNKYGIGKNDMGILIILSTGDRKIKGETGRRMEEYFNDSKVGRFIDNYAKELLKENKFSEALLSLQTGMIEELKRVLPEGNVSEYTNSSNPKSPDIDITLILFILILLLLFASIIAVVLSFNRKKWTILKLEDIIKEKNEKHKNEIASSIERNRQLESRYSKLDEQFQEATKQLSLLTDKYKRAMMIYPDIDQKVLEMIMHEEKEKNIKIASNVNVQLERFSSLAPCIEIIPELGNALREYKGLSQDQKQYITANIQAVNTLYNSCIDMKHRHLADEVTNKLTSILASFHNSAKEDDLETLNHAEGLLGNLDPDVRKYVDKEFAQKINNLMRQALRDKIANEELERQRRDEEIRRQNTFSSNDSSSSDSYGGFGGQSGGGGASRDF